MSNEQHYTLYDDIPKDLIEKPISRGEVAKLLTLIRLALRKPMVGIGLMRIHGLEKDLNEHLT